MTVSPSLNRALLAGLLLGLLAGCAGISPNARQPATPLPDQAAARAAQGDYAAAAQLYQQAAGQASGAGRNQLLLDGSEAASRSGNAALARKLLAGVDAASLNKQDHARLKLVRLEADIAGMPPKQALAKLPLPGRGAPPAVAARLWQLRSHLQLEQGHVVKAIHALVQRDVWLVDPAKVKANDYSIWNTLKHHQPPASARSADTITQGWIALADIAAQVWPSRDALDKALDQWARRYPSHPAARHILPEQFDYAPTAAAGTGNTIGLALPLTGKLAVAGTALENGFFAGYYDSQSDDQGANQPPPQDGDSPARPDVRVYDTNHIPDTKRLLEQARADGVGLLVGPLDKQAVSTLRDLPHPGIRVLALNYTDDNAGASNFYQFGLAPEDEARAAARRALGQDMQRAIALVPQGDWGGRVLSAFRDALQAGGGELLDYATYDPGEADYGQPIKQVLQYYQEDSQGGADFVFVAARPGPGRLIRTQLRFYHASRLPVLATSHVYSGVVNARRDSDLDGVTFADMPWLLGGNARITQRHDQSQNLWPDGARHYPRLYAMGFDAWLLSQRLRAGAPQPGPLFQGNTGALYLNGDGQIRRRLGWAHFSGGRPQLLVGPQFLPQPLQQQQQPGTQQGSGAATSDQTTGTRTWQQAP